VESGFSTFVGLKFWHLLDRLPFSQISQDV
jgi:hypothetical protein